ncbi:hypothetical protein PH603_01435 [Gimibacter soli]|uniref:Uncharacterized protein n=1 Tax=Gimibacter soli TaxID=3024400 RepID=A0AAF0BMD7_9PROT|nr:hypothetical protein [Gimibacter soli]WCL54420.1 hypothetical protein PH603_01435 [Gimibacter soli]
MVRSTGLDHGAAHVAAVRQITATDRAIVALAHVVTGHKGAANNNFKGRCGSWSFRSIPFRGIKTPKPDPATVRKDKRVTIDHALDVSR